MTDAILCAVCLDAIEQAEPCAHTADPLCPDCAIPWCEECRAIAGDDWADELALCEWKGE